MRHGEVFNPEGVLYGRIPGYHLSELGHRMAAAAAKSLAGRPVTALYASPLQRTQESAQPWADQFSLPIITDDRIIEPHNKFEGQKFAFSPKILARPKSWPLVVNPLRPSWGEPFVDVAARMFAAIDDAWEAADGGEVVMVSHQMPIWMVARAVAGNRLYHDPRKRRCNLSSITRLTREIRRPGSSVKRVLMAAAAVVAAATLLAGCAADPLAKQYASGTNQNYISGNGSVTEIPTENRGEPVSFAGETDTGEDVVEAPELEEVNQAFSGQGVSFLGVNVRDQAATSLTFAEETGISYPSVIDSNDGNMLLAFSGTVAPNAVPTTLIIDKQGRVAARFLGAIEGTSTLTTIIRDVLAEDG